MKIDIPDDALDEIVDQKLHERLLGVINIELRNLHRELQRITTVRDLARWSIIADYFVDAFSCNLSVALDLDFSGGELCLKLDPYSIPPGAELLVDAGLGGDGFALMRLASGRYGYWVTDYGWIEVKPTEHRYGPSSSQVTLEINDPWSAGLQLRVRLEDGAYTTRWPSAEDEGWTPAELEDMRRSWEQLLESPPKLTALEEQLR